MSWSPVLTLAAQLVVETGSPDALCPDLASAEQAIQARLGEIAAEGAADWRVRYTIGHAPDATSGDFVRLEVFDPANDLRLSRDLPLSGESCGTMAQVMALVVDRFFRAMVAVPKAKKPESAPAPAKAAAVPEDRSRPEPRRPGTLLTAQTGVIGPPLRPTVGLAFAQETALGLSLAVTLTWIVLPVREDLERGGRAELQSGLLRFVPSWDVWLGNARLALGPSVTLAGEWGSTSGLPESSEKYRTVLAAGAASRLRLALGEHTAFELSAGVEAPFLPFGGAFVIDGQEVLDPPSVRGFFAIGIGPAWFR